MFTTIICIPMKLYHKESYIVPLRQYPSCFDAHRGAIEYYEKALRNVNKLTLNRKLAG